MKILCATVILSILSAFVGVYSVTQLCASKPGALTGDSHPLTTNADARETKQVVQQWVNH